MCLDERGQRDSVPAAGRVAGEVDPAVLDSWLPSRRRSVTASVGKIDAGMGMDGVRAIVPRSSTSARAVTIVMGDSDHGRQARHGLVTIRRRGLAPAAPKPRGAARARLGAAQGSLRTATRANGVCSTADSSKRVSYGELVGGREFGVTMGEKSGPRTRGL